MESVDLHLVGYICIVDCRTRHRVLVHLHTVHRVLVFLQWLQHLRAAKAADDSVIHTRAWPNSNKPGPRLYYVVYAT